MSDPLINSEENPSPEETPRADEGAVRAEQNVVRYESAAPYEPAPPSESALPPLPPPHTRVPASPPKSPWLALVLSIFPGVGQIYNGQPSKAFIFFFGWVGCIYGVAEISPFPFAFLIPFVYFYNLVDAWRSANAINARVLGGAPLPEEESFESPWWGGSLLALGLLLLLNNLGLLRLAALSRWWPLIMIVAGGVFLWSSLRRRRPGR